MKKIKIAIFIATAMFFSTNVSAANVPFDGGDGAWTPWFKVSKMNLYLPSLNMCKYERYQFKKGKTLVQRKSSMC